MTPAEAVWGPAPPRKQNQLPWALLVFSFDAPEGKGVTTVLGMGIGDLNPQQSKAATCGYGQRLRTAVPLQTWGIR